MITKKCRNIFNIDNFNSKDGMLTSVWGPSLWHSLHVISFNYPVHPTKKQKKDYKYFITNLRNILPCGHCRDNLSKDLKKYPINMKVMKNRENFSKYIYDLHERINTLLNKKSGLSYEDVRERYEHFRASCSKKKIKHLKKLNIKVVLFHYINLKVKVLLKLYLIKLNVIQLKLTKNVN